MFTWEMLNNDMVDVVSFWEIYFYCGHKINLLFKSNFIFI